jgi:transcriptional/translational regulatory protein YebC/TACO1
MNSLSLAGFPKASVEAAIARGQGKSTSGAALENFTIECIMPPQIAMIIEAETDNRNRTLADLRLLVKTHGGTATPTSYLFQKKGRVAFEKDEKGLGIDEVLEDAIEAGAEDVELAEDGGIVLWTEPSKTFSAAESLSKAHGLKIDDTDIIWDANAETKVEIQEDDATAMLAFLDALQDNQQVQGTYANVSQGSVSESTWETLLGKLDG